jgi:hypothetical protein
MQMLILAIDKQLGLADAPICKRAIAHERVAIEGIFDKALLNSKTSEIAHSQLTAYASFEQAICGS